MEFVATTNHDTLFGLGFVPTEADYRYMMRLHRESVRAHLSCTPFYYLVRSYKMNLTDYFIRGLEVHPHMGDFGTVTDIDGVDELQHQLHHFWLGDDTFGTLVSVMIAPSSPYRADFLSLCIPEDTTDYGVVVEPTKVTDGVVLHDKYRDEMDMMSMS